MGWQGYIDQSLVGSGRIDKAAIISAAGDSIWAASPDFQLQTKEMKDCSLLLSDDSSTQGEVVARGLRIGGNRYRIAHIADHEPILAISGNSGVAVAKTKQAIIIGHYSERQNLANARMVVGQLADYLTQQGY